MIIKWWHDLHDICVPHFSGDCWGQIQFVKGVCNRETCTRPIIGGHGKPISGNKAEHAPSSGCQLICSNNAWGASTSGCQWYPQFPQSVLARYHQHISSSYSVCKYLVRFKRWDFYYLGMRNTILNSLFWTFSAWGVLTMIWWINMKYASLRIFLLGTSTHYDGLLIVLAVSGFSDLIQVPTNIYNFLKQHFRRIFSLQFPYIQWHQLKHQFKELPGAIRGPFYWHRFFQSEHG